ncbi:MAG: hypothetical protein ACI9QA_000322 [Methanobacteriota archaeon]|jgi:hypothetical protein
MVGMRMTESRAVHGSSVSTPERVEGGLRVMVGMRMTESLNENKRGGRP